MQKIDDTRNWQVYINDPLVVVQGVEDIAQCIYTILATVKGSDPLRASFGSDVYKHIDKPLNGIQPQLIFNAVEAIEKWEKRVKVIKCRVVANDIAGVIFHIEAIVVASAAQITMNIKI